MRLAFLGMAVLAVVVAGSVPATAHHSHDGFYDRCASVTITGQIESVQWKNPHVLIDLKTAGGSTYRAEWTSAGSLESRAIEPPKVGDRVEVTGHPMRDPAQIRATFPTLTLPDTGLKVVDLTQIRRASDSWSWTLEQERTPPRCAGK